jgi:hypothetical protein
MLGRIAVTVVVAAAVGTAGALDFSSERPDAVARLRPATRAVATPVADGPAPAAARTIPYEVRGFENHTDLEQFAAEVAATYADPRGWNLGGSVALVRVPSGGSFTVWLAAGARVPRFGGRCDRFYSCMQDRNVVINEDRWLSGSPAWNASGASLRDYRHMVVNHETGHWLGFTHAECAGPGGTAAVMQQQSISLQGCWPSAWPSPGERQWAAVALGVENSAGLPDGALESVTPARRGVRARGWALDPDTPGPTLVMVRVDADASGHAAAQPRYDIAFAHPGTGVAHGFDLAVAAAPGRHRVCVDALNVSGSGRPIALGCRVVRAAGARPGSSRPN